MKILLVEDVRSVVQVLTGRLNSYGYEVFHARDGQEAVQMFPSVCPDLILMDIEMPVMNGFEATNSIRAIEATQQWAWTPIIFLTSSDTVKNLLTAIEAGGDDFMSKFVPEPVLQAKMKAMSRIANLRHRLAFANTKLLAMAGQDGLTGLLNRRSMDTKLDEMWLRSTFSSEPFAVLMLDIDNFKKYNDHYGHLAGDDCLKQIAGVIDDAVRRSNAMGLTIDAFAARYGGEEFAVIIPTASQAAYERLAADIVATVFQLGIAHEKNDGWGVGTLSLGGCRVEAANNEVRHVFIQADKNLYQAKTSGRNRAEL